MGVKKFRSIEEMDGEVWREPSPALWKAIAAVWDFAERTVGGRFPPGVYKHRTIEEAKELREQWDEANFRRYQERTTPPVEPGSGRRD
jgi:hypothetical protein